MTEEAASADRLDQLLDELATMTARVGEIRAEIKHHFRLATLLSAAADPSVQPPVAPPAAPPALPDTTMGLILSPPPDDPAQAPGSAPPPAGVLRFTPPRPRRGSRGVAEALRSALDGGPLHVQQLYDILSGVSRGSIHSILRHECETGRVQRVRYGIYGLTSAYRAAKGGTAS